MKTNYFKKFISLALVFCLIFSVSPISIWAADATNNTYTNSAGDSATLAALEDGKYALSLHFANHYTADTNVSGKNTSSDAAKLNGVAKQLLQGAVEKYNSNNGTALTAPALGSEAKFTDVNYSITELTVTSDKNIYVSGQLFFRLLPTDGFVNLKKIDMSGMNYTGHSNPENSTYQNVIRAWGTVNNGGTFTGIDYTYYITETETTTVAESNSKSVLPNLEELILPNTIKTIGRNALRNLSVKSLDIPDTVTQIEDYSLRRMSNLQSVKLPAGLINYGTSDGSTFATVTEGQSNTPADDWSYHGTALTDGSWNQLLSDINKNHPVALDFSGSSITIEQLKLINNTENLTSLNISGCENIENVVEGTTEYDEVANYISGLRANGVNVNTQIKLSNTYADADGNTATLYLKGADSYRLELHFAKHYTYTATGINDGKNQSTDETALNGVVKKLVVGATKLYSLNEGVFLTAPNLGEEAKFTDVNYSITELVVTSAENIYVSGYLFNSLLATDGFVNLKKIDMSGMNYTWHKDPTRETMQNVMGPNQDVNNAGVFTGHQFAYYESADSTEPVVISAGNDNCAFSNLTELLLPDTLTKIGINAFRSLTNITYLDIPEGVVSIGACAFRKCNSLTEINLPDALESYGKDTNGKYETTLYSASANVDKWSYHGKVLDEASRNRLVLDINKYGYKSVDLKDSCFTTADILAITANAASLELLDIRGCDTDWTTSEGASLAANIFTLKQSGLNILVDDTYVNYLPKIYTDSDGNKAKIVKKDDGSYILELHFAKHHTYTTSGINDGKNQSSDTTSLNGVLKSLIKGAVNVYNINNKDANLTAPNLGEEAKFTDVNYSITELVVTSAENIYVSGYLFNSLLATDGFVNLKKIDMSGMNYTWRKNPDKEDMHNVMGPNQDVNNAGVFTGQKFAYYISDTEMSTVESSNSNSVFPNLEELILPNTLEKMGASALRGLSKIKKIEIPDSVMQIDNYALRRMDILECVKLPAGLVNYGTSDGSNFATVTEGKDRTPANNWIYHGTQLTDGSWDRLIKDINANDPILLDFSGSNITVENILALDTEKLTYIDIRDCEMVEYISDNGKQLLDMLIKLEEGGVTVLKPDPEELASKVLFFVKSSQNASGTVKGTKLYDREALPVTVNAYAIAAEGYELKGWQVDDSDELIPADAPDADGVYKLSYELQPNAAQVVKIVAVFQIKLLELPGGNDYIIKDDKLYITLTDVTSDTVLNIWTQAIVRRASEENNREYTFEDIVSLKISTADDVKLSKAFTNVFFESHIEAFKSNLTAIDISDAVYKNNTLPESMFDKYSALSSLLLPKNLEKIGNRAIQYCTSLTAIDIPDSVKTIGDRAFAFSGIVQIDIPEALEVYGSLPFWKSPEFIGTDTVSANGNDYNIIKLPDTVVQFGESTKHIIYSYATHPGCGATYALEGTKVSGIEYHGAGDKQLFSHLLADPSWKTAYFDLSNSGLTEKELSLFPFSSVTTTDTTVRTCYIDVRGCQIDWTTSRGKKLLQKIEEFVKNNPKATVLYDEGIVRDTSYTPVVAEIVLADGISMEQVLKDWATANNTSVSAITDLKINTSGSREMSSVDFNTIKSVIVDDNGSSTLRVCDISDAALLDNTIPAKAFEGMEYLRQVSVPSDVEVIEEFAFFGTDITSFYMPSAVRIIGDEAFNACYSLEGEMVLPNGLEEIGTDVFAAAGFTSLEYHGTIDPNIKSNFAYAISTLEYVDLRGVKAITYDNLPTKWDALKEAHFDYCSIENEKLYHDQLWFSISRADGVIITALHQFEDYENLETMLNENLYGKTDSDYPADYTGESNYDFSSHDSWAFDESGNPPRTVIVENSSDSTNGENNQSSENNGTSIKENDTDSDDDDTKTITVRKKRKKKNTNTNTVVDYTPYIIIGSVVVVVIAAIVVLIIVLKKRKKNSKKTKEEE